MTLAAQRTAPLILAVDDDDLSREMIQQILQDAGFRVVAASDGAQALALYAEHEPDLVLLDVLMPGLTGHEVCARIRAHEHSRYTPIIMLTALDDVGAITRSFQCGATDFITKPIVWPLLTERVRYALRGAQLALQLRDNQQRLEAVHRIARMGHFEWHLPTRELTCSDFLCELIGIEPKKLDGSLQTFLNYVHPESRTAFTNLLEQVAASGQSVSLDHRIVRPDASERFVYSRAEVILDRHNTPVRVLGIVHDVTERTQAEQRAHFLAYHDDLTQLPNRTLFQDRIKQATAEAKRHQRLLGVLLLDLDRFKNVNDSYSHEVGDALLKAVAQRLERLVRKGDTLARLGGDEFGIVLTQVAHPEDAAKIAQRIIDTLDLPFDINAQEFFTTASIGITVYPHDGADSETLVKNADTALNQAKQAGRNNFQFYQAEMNAHSRERLTMEGRLRHALKRDDFLLYLQPQVRLSDGKVRGAEALLRWRDGPHEVVTPAKFIPILEETGLIVAVGEWILRAACRWSREWQDKGCDFSVAVNVSARQFADPSFVDSVLDILAETGVSPAKIELELTESTLLANEAHTLAVLSALKSAGIKLAIDDYGTGYSSLAYLKRLPVDYLKVDRSFVLNMITDENDQVIVRSTIELAHNLGLHVIAEGVEDFRALRLLRDMRCELAQGFFIAMPLTKDQFSAWLTGYQKFAGMTPAIRS